jgi:hypothetical protein
MTVYDGVSTVNLIMTVYDGVSTVNLITTVYDGVSTVNLIMTVYDGVSIQYSDSFTQVTAPFSQLYSPQNEDVT